MKLLPKQWKNLSFWGVFFFALFSHQCNAQDTLRIFYTSGEHKLYPNSKIEINGFIFSHELKYVDSISLNGYTDSTGQVKKNQKLSEKRALTVEKYLYRIGISDTVPISTQAKGEESENENPNLENHRRVELILYFTKSYVPIEEEEEKPSGNFVNSNCYMSAEDVMSKSNLTYYMKGNTRYVKLEMEASLMNKSQRYYSLTARNRYPKLVKWEVQTTGYWWWKRPRYIANMKAKDYEKYGVVVLHETDTNNREACTICGTDPQTEWYLHSRLVEDQFLLENMTLKKKWLPSRIEIAVPKAYVSIGKGYYLDSLTNYPIQWTIKNTRNAAPFYYTEVPKQYFNAADFKIYSYRKVCANQEVRPTNPNPIDTNRGLPCRPSFGSWVDFSAGLQFDYRHFSRDEGMVSGYFQLPYNQFLFQANAGYTSKNRSYVTLSADFHFFGFSPFGEYKASSNPVVTQENWRKITGYLGNSFTSFFGKNQNQLINEFHLGISYWNSSNGAGFESLFIEGGLCFDFSNLKSSEKWSVRTGLRFRIY